ncbi:hypothetical protein CYMTET_31908, partial [Cymbomonas tetramitiformis]
VTMPRLAKSAEQKVRMDAEEDWEQDTNGTGRMFFPQFEKAMFQLVDLWTNDASEISYIDFIHNLRRKVGAKPGKKKEGKKGMKGKRVKGAKEAAPESLPALDENAPVQATQGEGERWVPPTQGDGERWVPPRLLGEAAPQARYRDPLVVPVGQSPREPPDAPGVPPAEQQVYGEDADDAWWVMDGSWGDGMDDSEHSEDEDEDEEGEATPRRTGPATAARTRKKRARRKVPAKVPKESPQQQSAGPSQRPPAVYHLKEGPAELAALPRGLDEFEEYYAKHQEDTRASAPHGSRGHNRQSDKDHDDLGRWEGTPEPPVVRAQRTKARKSAPPSSGPEPKVRIPRSSYRARERGGASQTPPPAEREKERLVNREGEKILVRSSHFFGAGLGEVLPNSGDGFEILGFGFQTLEQWDNKEEEEEEEEEEGMLQGAHLLERRRSQITRDRKEWISDDRSIDVAAASTASSRTPPADLPPADFSQSDMEMDRMRRRTRGGTIFEPKVGMKTELFGGETEELLVSEVKPQFLEYVGAMHRLAERTKRYIRKFAKLMDYRPYDPRDHWKPFDESFALNLPSLPALGPSRWSKLDEGKKGRNELSPPKAASPDLHAELPLAHTATLQSSS